MAPVAAQENPLLLVAAGEEMDTLGVMKERLGYDARKANAPMGIPFGKLRFKERPKAFDPHAPEYRGEKYANGVTPLIVPVFRQGSSLAERVQALRTARESFPRICEAIAAPGWAFPDLFRVFVMDPSTVAESGGAWWGNVQTARPGLRAVARRMEAQLSKSTPTDEARNSRDAYLAERIADLEQVLPLKREELRLAKAEGDPATTVQVLEADVQDLEKALADAKANLGGCTNAPESEFDWTWCHVELLHPCPLVAKTEDLNALALVAEALKQTTAEVDLELFVQGFGELARGMMHFKNGKAHLAPVAWPGEGGQVSCLASINEDLLALLAAFPWVAAGHYNLYGMSPLVSENADGSLSETETAKKVWGTWHNWISEHRERLGLLGIYRKGISLFMPTASRQDALLHFNMETATAAGVAIDEPVISALKADQTTGRLPEAGEAYCGYWRLRDAMGKLFQLLLEAEDAAPAVGSSETENHKKAQVQIATRKGMTLLESEAQRLHDEDDAPSAFVDKAEFPLRAALVEAYENAVILWNAQDRVLREIPSLALAAAITTLAGVEKPEIDLGMCFIPMEPSSPVYKQGQGWGLGSGLSTGILPMMKSDDGSWLYLAFGSMGYQAGMPFTNSFQTVSAKSAAPLHGVWSMTWTPMSKRIEAQQTYNPSAGRAPHGKWRMLAKEPFFSLV